IPTRTGTANGGPSPFGSRRLGAGARNRMSPTVDDRPRRGDELARPELLLPELKPSVFQSSVDADGFARLDSLSSLAVDLEITCGPFSAKVEVPASRATTTVRALFQRTSVATTTDREASTLLEFERAPLR